MPALEFVLPDQSTRTVDAAVGQTVMDAAVAAMIPGIPAECGGSCACGTCHVHVDEAWFARLPTAGETELSMIEGTDVPAATSRLSCQIRVTPELHGLRVRVPRG